MRIALTLLAIALFPFGVAATAWAEPQSQTNDSESLGAHQVGVEELSADDSERYSTIETQINDQFGGDEEEPLIDIELPEGMVVRPSNSGLAIGTELE